MKPRADFKKYLVEKYLNLDFKGLSSYDNNRDYLKQTLYMDFTSGDESKSLSAAKIIRHLDNLNFSKEEIDNIKQISSQLLKSDICRMYDYRLDIKDAIDILENFELGNCKCKLYPEKTSFSPDREIELGLVVLIEDPFVNKELYQYEYRLRCTNCKSEWLAIEQHSGHYPWTKWTEK